MDQPIEAKLKELLAFADKHGLMEMAWQENGTRIAFRRSASATVAELPAAPENDAEIDTPAAEEIIRSPMVGKFRRSMSKDRPPVVMIGNHIKPGDRVGVVECMKIPTDVVSFCAGEIREILVEDGQVVEYGQPLFKVIPFNAGAEASAN